MNTVGQIERAIQNRLIQLFQTQLRYDYLGNWEKRDNNRNVETELLGSWLAQLESRLAKTRDMKAGLMQELLTGKIRLGGGDTSRGGAEDAEEGHGN